MCWALCFTEAPRPWPWFPWTSAAAIDEETAPVSLPGQFLLHQHADHPYTEELLQRSGAHPGRNLEHAVVSEQAVGHEGVDMAIVAHVLAEEPNLSYHQSVDIVAGDVSFCSKHMLKASSCSTKPCSISHSVLVKKN